MATKDRLAVFPTPGQYTMIRTKITSAVRSEKILQQKADGITMRYRAVAIPLIENKDKVRELMRDAFLALAEARFVMSNLNLVIFHNVTNKSLVKVVTNEEHVAGVRLSHISVCNDGPDSNLLTGLGTGNTQVAKAKRLFREAIDLLITIASQQNAFVNFGHALSDTNRRLNATSNLIIPRLENTASWIQTEMFELEREDFYRMKKIKNKKMAAAAAREAVRRAAAAAGDTEKAAVVSPVQHDVLFREDDDLLFND